MFKEDLLKGKRIFVTGESTFSGLYKFSDEDWE